MINNKIITNNPPPTVLLIALSSGLSGGKRLKVINRRKCFPNMKSKGEKKAYNTINPIIPNIALIKSTILITKYFRMKNP